MCDFETGLTVAIRQEFPQAILRGCYFHHTEAIFRKVQKYGLVTKYRKDPDIQAAIRQLMAIGFLPADRIRPFFDRLAEKSSSSIGPLLAYYSKFWIEQIGPERLSVYGHQVRTNNNVESWHASFNKLVGKAHPNVFELIDCIRKEQDST